MLMINTSSSNGDRNCYSGIAALIDITLCPLNAYSGLRPLLQAAMYQKRTSMAGFNSMDTFRVRAVTLFITVISVMLWRRHSGFVINKNEKASPLPG